METEYAPAPDSILFEELPGLGYVELIDVMPSGEPADLAVVKAARVSYKSGLKGNRADKKLIRYLYEHGHTSPFEQVEFKFRIHAPIVVWWQLVRHRMAELNMSSGRYTEYPDEDYYLPAADQWRAQDTKNKQASGGYLSPEVGDGLTWELSELQGIAYERYKRAIEYGVSREQARLFLPAFTLKHTGIWKVNAHSLMNVIAKRNHQDAQSEIQAVGGALERIFEAVMPWTYEILADMRAKEILERAERAMLVREVETLRNEIERPGLGYLVRQFRNHVVASFRKVGIAS